MMQLLLMFWLFINIAIAGYGDGKNPRCDKKADSAFDQCNKTEGKDANPSCIDVLLDAHDDCTGKDTRPRPKDQSSMIAENYRPSEKAKNAIGEILEEDFRRHFCKWVSMETVKDPKANRDFTASKPAKRAVNNIIKVDMDRYCQINNDCAEDLQKDHIERTNDCVENYPDFGTEQDRKEYDNCIRDSINKYTNDLGCCENPKVDSVQNDIETNPMTRDRDVDVDYDCSSVNRYIDDQVRIYKHNTGFGSGCYKQVKELGCKDKDRLEMLKMKCRMEKMSVSEIKKIVKGCSDINSFSTSKRMYGSDIGRSEDILQHKMGCRENSGFFRKF